MGTNAEDLREWQRMIDAERSGARTYEYIPQIWQKTVQTALQNNDASAHLHEVFNKSIIWKFPHKELNYNDKTIMKFYPSSFSSEGTPQISVVFPFFPVENNTHEVSLKPLELQCVFYSFICGIIKFLNSAAPRFNESKHNFFTMLGWAAASSYYKDSDRPSALHELEMTTEILESMNHRLLDLEVAPHMFHKL